MSVYFRIWKEYNSQKEDYTFSQPLEECKKFHSQGLSVIDGKPISEFNSKMSYHERANFNVFFAEMLDGNKDYLLHEEENLFLINLKVGYELSIRKNNCIVL